MRVTGRPMHLLISCSFLNGQQLSSCFGLQYLMSPCFELINMFESFMSKLQTVVNVSRNEFLRSFYYICGSARVQALPAAEFQMNNYIYYSHSVNLDLLVKRLKVFFNQISITSWFRWLTVKIFHNNYHVCDNKDIRGYHSQKIFFGLCLCNIRWEKAFWWFSFIFGQILVFYISYHILYFILYLMIDIFLFWYFSYFLFRIAWAKNVFLTNLDSKFGENFYCLENQYSTRTSLIWEFFVSHFLTFFSKVLFNDFTFSFFVSIIYSFCSLVAVCLTINDIRKNEYSNFL